jgi:hypothetical protein|tara:strand:+ start:662 stop:805 length:144 start_codon:yes stop_codon:yes gene_type:complete
MIKKVGNKFVLFSKDGSRKLGTFATRKEAAEREAKISVMKRMDQRKP